MKPVSADTEHRLWEALARLMAGQPLGCDGQLTVSNLAREAGVARSTVNRAEAVLAQLRHAITLKQASLLAKPARVNNQEQSCRANENILAQHIQLRALLRGEEQRRGIATGIVVPIVRR